MGLISLLWFVAGLVSLVGFVWLCVVAFRRHVGWGLAVLFLSPIAAIVFAAKHWQSSRKPFLVYIGSCAMLVVLVVAAFTSLGGFQMMGMAARMSRGEELGQEEAGRFVGDRMQRMEDSGMLTPEQEAELQRMQAMYSEMQHEASESEASSDSIAPGSDPDSNVPDAGSATPRSGTVRTTPSRPSDARSTHGAVADVRLAPPGYKRVSLGEAIDYVGQTVRVMGKDGNEHRGRLAEVGRDMLLVERHLTGGIVRFELAREDVDSLLVAYR